jgi:hypothetical protein
VPIDADSPIGALPSGFSQLVMRLGRPGPVAQPIWASI